MAEELRGKRKQECNCRTVCEVVAVLLATLTYAAKVVVTTYSWWGEPSSLSLTLSLQSAFRKYQLSISPGEWTHALWLVIFAVEGLWLLLLAWRFICCRQNIPRTIFLGFYPAFSLACALHIGWVFSWGRELHELALALLGLLTVVLFVSVGMVSGYLYYIRGTLRFYYQFNFILTRILVLNGMVAYATFSFILALFNLGAVLTENCNLPDKMASTIILSLLSSTVVTYFLLESTILDRFLRYVVVVYPVVLWTLTGILTEVWEGQESSNDRNQLFVLVLACVVGFLTVIRVVMLVGFYCKRPLQEYESSELETVPLGVEGMTVM